MLIEGAMDVPDELRKLYDDTAEQAIANGVGLAEVDDVALAAVLGRYEQMVRAKLADAMEAAVMPLPDPMYVQGWLAGAEFVRGGQ